MVDKKVLLIEGFGHRTAWRIVIGLACQALIKAFGNHGQARHCTEAAGSRLRNFPDGRKQHLPGGFAVPGIHPVKRGIPVVVTLRSEERRVGKECVSTCRSRWSPYH